MSPYPDYTASNTIITVTLTDIGEGYEGDYDPTDPDDWPLYRVDVTRVNDPDSDDYGSYCTGIVCNDPDVDYQHLTDRMLTYATTRITAGHTCNQIAASMSWFTTSNLTDQFGNPA